LLLLSAPALALAHAGAEHATGFAHGFGHPLGGTDHFLAMAAVGLWAMQIGRQALWLVPATFVGVMMLGGVLGFSGIDVPFIEQGILLSVLILGVLIAGAFKLPLAVSAALVGVFALFHGHAHGAEMPLETGALSYTLGFALATALLHLTGIVAGALLQRANLPLISRVLGGAIALGGVVLAVV
jgi:urease accessory protein